MTPLLTPLVVVAIKAERRYEAIHSVLQSRTVLDRFLVALRRDELFMFVVDFSEVAEHRIEEGDYPVVDVDAFHPVELAAEVRRFEYGASSAAGIEKAMRPRKLCDYLVCYRVLAPFVGES